MRILIIDNYDSFTFNLLQYVGEVGPVRFEDFLVRRNDEISVPEVAELSPSHIIISPGPCTPNEAGVSIELVQELSGKFPMLGVCLGHQVMAQAFGGRVVRAPEPKHGKTSRTQHDGTGIFKDVEQGFTATRYHSLIAEESTFPSCLRVTARSEEGLIMALEHREHPLTVGVQFHPESILTAVGKQLLKNFLEFSCH